MAGLSRNDHFFSPYVWTTVPYCKMSLYITADILATCQPFLLFFSSCEKKEEKQFTGQKKYNCIQKGLGGLIRRAPLSALCTVRPLFMSAKGRLVFMCILYHDN